MRRLVNNLAELEENKTTISEEDLANKFLELIAQSENLDEALDIDAIIKEVRSLISDKSEVKEIFEALYDVGCKRAEVCDLLGLKASDYDNQVRQLRRIVENQLKSNGYERKK